VVDDSARFHPVIVAGDPNGTPTDSPSLRVDTNASNSAFAGVGSLRVNTTSGTYICTATPYDATHVLSAAHCVDINNDGRLTFKDGVQSVIFQLNLDTDSPTDQVDVSINASSYRIHPDYTGFGRPSVNDDLSVITLSSSLPAGVPTYALHTTALGAGTTRLVMVGYGDTGTGTGGYTGGASFTVKRRGENMVDAFYGQDDRRKPAANEVFRFDFDGPSGNGSFGGPTLGNDVETTLGGGDSGGPSFVRCNGCDPALASSYTLAGVNTFTQGSAPFFGSLGGGIAVQSYVNWILTGSATASGSGGESNGNSNGPATGNSLGRAASAVIVMPADPTQAPTTDAAPGDSAELWNDSITDLNLQGSSTAEFARVPATEAMVVIITSSPSSNSSSDSGKSDDDFVNALDAILDDWLPLVGD
jgi:hypothetical protein